MSRTEVEIGKGNVREVDEVALICPFCHSKVLPKYLFLHEDFLFAYCPNSHCNKHFVLGYDFLDQGFTAVLPNSEPKHKQFSKTILRTSPDFPVIYNQAYHAEQVGLNQICGVGYRKALEFLIKDFLMADIDENDTEKRDRIKNKFLGNCIEQDVTNEHIKTVAKRAVWLGNDETHYVRKWTNKDVSHLKQLIELTVHWIESEIETKALLDEMPE